MLSGLGWGFGVMFGAGSAVLVLFFIVAVLADVLRRQEAQRV